MNYIQMKYAIDQLQSAEQETKRELTSVKEDVAKLKADSVK